MSRISRDTSVRCGARRIDDAEDVVREADLVDQRDARRDAAGRPDARFPASGCEPGRSCSTWSTARRRHRAGHAARGGRRHGARRPRACSSCQGATAVDIWNGDAQTRTPRDVMRAAPPRRARAARRRRWRLADDDARQQHAAGHGSSSRAGVINDEQLAEAVADRRRPAAAARARRARVRERGRASRRRSPSRWGCPSSTSARTTSTRTPRSCSSPT